MDNKPTTGIMALTERPGRTFSKAVLDEKREKLKKKRPPYPDQQEFIDSQRRMEGS